jgi:aspartate aminotransferase
VEAWCHYYATLGIRFEPRDIVVTTGGGEAIGFAMMTVADPEDEILIFDPTYASYQSYAATSTITLVPIPLAPPDYHLPREDVIEQHITPRTRAIVLINPNNPTGTVYGEQELAAVMDVAERHQLFVIADETYRELVFDGRTHVSAMDFPGMEDAVILVDSASKRFSATGLRVGCVASRNVAVSSAMLRLAQARLSCPTIEQLAIVPLLEHPGTYTAWLRDEYESRRDVAYDALQTISGIRMTRPEGAFYVMVSLPIDDADTFARWLLTDFQREGETVMVAPGAGFYVTPGMGRHDVRLAYVLGGDTLRRAVDLLGVALDAYPGRLSRMTDVDLRRSA